MQVEDWAFETEHGFPRAARVTTKAFTSAVLQAAGQQARPAQLLIEAVCVEGCVQLVGCVLTLAGAAAAGDDPAAAGDGVQAPGTAVVEEVVQQQQPGLLPAAQHTIPDAPAAVQGPSTLQSASTAQPNDSIAAASSSNSSLAISTEPSSDEASFQMQPGPFAWHMYNSLVQHADESTSAQVTRQTPAHSAAASGQSPVSAATPVPHSTSAGATPASEEQASAQPSQQQQQQPSTSGTGPWKLYSPFSALEPFPSDSEDTAAPGSQDSELSQPAMQQSRPPEQQQQQQQQEDAGTGPWKLHSPFSALPAFSDDDEASDTQQDSAAAPASLAANAHVDVPLSSSAQQVAQPAAVTGPWKLSSPFGAFQPFDDDEPSEAADSSTAARVADTASAAQQPQQHPDSSNPAAHPSTDAGTGPWKLHSPFATLPAFSDEDDNDQHTVHDGAAATSGSDQLPSTHVDKHKRPSPGSAAAPRADHVSLKSQPSAGTGPWKLQTPFGELPAFSDNDEDDKQEDQGSFGVQVGVASGVPVGASHVGSASADSSVELSLEHLVATQQQHHAEGPAGLSPLGRQGSMAVTQPGAAPFERPSKVPSSTSSTVGEAAARMSSSAMQAYGSLVSPDLSSGSSSRGNSSETSASTPGAAVAVGAAPTTQVHDSSTSYQPGVRPARSTPRVQVCLNNQIAVVDAATKSAQAGGASAPALTIAAAAGAPKLSTGPQVGDSVAASQSVPAGTVSTVYAAPSASGQPRLDAPQQGVAAQVQLSCLCCYPPCLSEGQPAEVHVYVSGLDQLSASPSGGKYRMVAFQGAMAVADIRGVCTGGEGLIK